MIHFNELRITEDNKYLIIDVSVDSDSCFDDVTLDTIIVDNQDTYVDNGPSSNPVLSIDVKEHYTKVLTDIPQYILSLKNMSVMLKMIKV